MTLDGATPGTVRSAVADGEPLHGTRGFAGRLDGAFLRDVLGRVPLYSEHGTPGAWAFDPTALDDPDPVSAGHRRSGGSRWSSIHPDTTTATRHLAAATPPPTAAPHSEQATR